IGMHVKHVQIPVRPILRELGGAHVTSLSFICTSHVLHQ
ncbi:DUF436 family protein, partial [Lactococcus lactis]